MPLVADPIHRQTIAPIDRIVVSEVPIVPWRECPPRRIGELTDVGDRQQRAFVDGLVAATDAATLSTVTWNVPDAAAAVVVADGHRDRVNAVVGVDVAAVERPGREHAGAAGRVDGAGPVSTAVPSPQLIA